MGKKDIKELSSEELRKKEQSLKTILVLFLVIVLALLFFVFRDYFQGEELNLPVLIITITSIGGMASVWPQYQAIQQEKKARELL